MAVNYPPEHPLSIEMAKWNKPYTFQAYPRMLYRAQRAPGSGKILCVDPTNEAWTGSNQFIVMDENEFLKATADGWAETPDKAIEVFNKQLDGIATEAAIRHHEDRKMSKEAQADVAAREPEGIDHAPEIKAQPVPPKREKRGPGRPRKNR